MREKNERLRDNINSSTPKSSNQQQASDGQQTNQSATAVDSEQQQPPKVITEPAPSSTENTDHVTIDQMRKMKKLADDVDRRVHELNLDGFSSSESSEEDGSDSKSKSRRHRSWRKKHSGKLAKLTTKVRAPMLWPHAVLSVAYVSKAVPYEELSFPEFVVGYVTIMARSDISAEELKHRTSHLILFGYALSIDGARCSIFTEPFC